MSSVLGKRAPINIEIPQEEGDKDLLEVVPPQGNKRTTGWRRCSIGPNLRLLRRFLLWKLGEHLIQHHNYRTVLEDLVEVVTTTVRVVDLQKNSLVPLCRSKCFKSYCSKRKKQKSHHPVGLHIVMNNHICLRSRKCVRASDTCEEGL